MDLFSAILKLCLSLIFPRKCVNCSKEGKYLCEACLEWSKSQWLLCPYCKRPTPTGKTHEACRVAFGLDGLIAVYRYKGIIRKAIGVLKYRFVTDIVSELSQALGRNIVGVMYLETPILVPIPLSRKRKNWRGFNQAEEIGKLIVKRLKWEYEPKLLIRTKHTKPQVGLTKEERLRNICGEFAVNNDILASKEDFKDQKTLVVFDDVWTSGATIKEACKELKKAGFKKVWGMVVAR